MNNLTHVYWYAVFGAYEMLNQSLITLEKKVPQEIEERFTELSLTRNRSAEICEKFIAQCEKCLSDAIDNKF